MAGHILSIAIAASLWFTTCTLAAPPPPPPPPPSYASTPAQPSLSCSASAITRPALNGTRILDLTAEERHNQTVNSTFGTYAGVYVVSYCGVNITYIHPQWNDTIHVEIWLPLDAWNGRFLGMGGGSWTAGYGANSLAPAIAQGFAAVSTDAGHPNGLPSASSWALSSPGNVNLPLLRDFASLALPEMAVFGKAVTKSYYGTAPKFSYWAGCSTGGRQGMMLAQRYPDMYDGILAIAPAINWDTFVMAEYWPQQVMNRLGVYPEQCELQAFTQAAVSACDEFDGVSDGVILDNTACGFDPHSVVGKSFDCNGTKRTFSSAGAAVLEAVWTGPVNGSGSKVWHGWSYDASTSAVATTVATPNGTIGVPFQISADWIQLFLAKDPSFPIRDMSNEQYFDMLRQSQAEYASIIDTSDPDLSRFKANNGKLITWHGTSDQVIPPNGTRDYYQRVTEQVPDTQDFYRFFEAPGVQHCGGGLGFQPTGDIEALVAWVEKGVAPETLKTVNATMGAQASGSNNATVSRNICAWPKKQRYQGGDPALSTSFTCEEPTAKVDIQFGFIGRDHG